MCYMDLHRGVPTEMLMNIPAWASILLSVNQEKVYIYLSIDFKHINVIHFDDLKGLW